MELKILLAIKVSQTGEHDGHENSDTSPAANALSDELTLACSLRACEAGLVSCMLHSQISLYSSEAHTLFRLTWNFSIRWSKRRFRAWKLG